MAARSQSLTDACAPVLLYLTTFRRNSVSSTQTIEGLQQALHREFEKVRRVCDEDARLRRLFERAFYALVAAADQIVLTSSWSQRVGWRMQLMEQLYFDELPSGGQKFFTFVDEILGDPKDGAVEIAELLFTCMALGFQGELMDEPRELERRKRQLYEKARLPGRMGEVLTPEAYGRDVPRRMPRLPTLGILRRSLIAVGVVLFTFLASYAVTEFFRNHYDSRVEAGKAQAQTRAMRGE